MREWSRLLHEATGGRLYVGSVDVIVPGSWSDAPGGGGGSGSGGGGGDECRHLRGVSPARLATYAEADVRVGLSHPLFGDAPFTQQSRDCSHQGDFISTTDAFFDRLAVSNITDLWIHGNIPILSLSLSLPPPSSPFLPLPPSHFNSTQLSTFTSIHISFINLNINI